MRDARRRCARASASNTLGINSRRIFFCRSAMQQSTPRQKKKGPPAQSPGRSPNRRSPPHKRRGAQNLARAVGSGSVDCL